MNVKQVELFSEFQVLVAAFVAIGISRRELSISVCNVGASRHVKVA